MTVRITPESSRRRCASRSMARNQPQNPVPAVPGNSGTPPPSSRAVRQRPESRQHARGYVSQKGSTYLARAGNSRDAHDRRAGPVTSSVGATRNAVRTLQRRDVWRAPRRQRRPRRWPDLRTIGDRDDADSLIRSILTPNQIIVGRLRIAHRVDPRRERFTGIFESEAIARSTWCS